MQIHTQALSAQIPLCSSEIAVTWNCCRTGDYPNFSTYRALELHAVVQQYDETAICYSVAQCDFLSLYGRRPDGELEALHDFPLGFTNTAAIVARVMPFAIEQRIPFLDSTV